jgi:hypothetical protein
MSGLIIALRRSGCELLCAAPSHPICVTCKGGDGKLGKARARLQEINAIASPPLHHGVYVCMPHRVKSHVYATPSQYSTCSL